MSTQQKEPRLNDKTTELVVTYVLMIGIGGRPNGHVYAEAMNRVSLELHQIIMGTLEANGICTIKNHWVSLTARGKKMHDEFAAILARGIASAAAQTTTKA